MSNTQTVNPDPLKKVLREIKRAEREIEDAKGQAVLIGKEVDDLLSSVSPGDAEGARALGLKKTHLDIIPYFLERRTREVGELHAKLCEEIYAFKEALLAAFNEEAAAFSGEMETVLRPWFPNGIGAIPGHSPVIGLIFCAIQRVIEAVQFVSLSLENAIKGAEVLLAEYEAWKANGGHIQTADKHREVFGK